MYVEIKHPCVQHKLGILRNKHTEHKQFRELATEVTMFVCYEALKHLEVKEIMVETPLCQTLCYKITDDVLVVPILRAGISMLDGILSIVPTARVGFVGVYRDQKTKKPIEYYKKFPEATDNTLCIVVDPMLATGGSIVATLDLLKKHGLKRAIVVCIVTCPEGISVVEQAYPNVPIYAASVDKRLDENKYIVPGLGDAGDRLYGTL
ncbi:MAG: uracil phosphoribosyltransferase [Anaerolineaceae bacterium 4572_78]|nr:MAG: uracil phosphoribosyltransferase [Anaerolineaceae bacterium 4572_78]